MSEALKEWIARRAEKGLCTSLIWHGPVHQSKTFCTREGKHEVHSAVYGSYRQHAEWKGPEASSGFFDEPPNG